MTANIKKLTLAMARACVTPKELEERTGMPRPSINNVLGGRSVRPATLGKIARALNVDPAEIIQEEE